MNSFVTKMAALMMSLLLAASSSADERDTIEGKTFFGEGNESPWAFYYKLSHIGATSDTVEGQLIGKPISVNWLFYGMVSCNEGNTLRISGSAAHRVAPHGESPSPYTYRFAFSVDGEDFGEHEVGTYTWVNPGKNIFPHEGHFDRYYAFLKCTFAYQDIVNYKLTVKGKHYADDPEPIVPTTSALTPEQADPPSTADASGFATTLIDPRNGGTDLSFTVEGINTAEVQTVELKIIAPGASGYPVISLPPDQWTHFSDYGSNGVYGVIDDVTIYDSFFIMEITNGNSFLVLNTTTHPSGAVAGRLTQPEKAAISNSFMITEIKVASSSNGQNEVEIYYPTFPGYDHHLDYAQPSSWLWGEIPGGPLNSGAATHSNDLPTCVYRARCEAVMSE